MSSDDEEENNDEAAVARRVEMSSWFKFCKEKVDKIEKVWNKKLEEESKSTGEDDPSSEDEKEKEEAKKSEEYEKSLQEMFENFGKRNLSKSFQGSAEQDPALVEARQKA